MSFFIGFVGQRKCGPVLSLRNVDNWSSIVPSGKTTSRPKMVPRSDPYRRRRRPPALVATFPPIWQLLLCSFRPDSKKHVFLYGPAFCAEIKGHDVVIRRNVVGQRLENTTSFCNQYSCTDDDYSRKRNRVKHDINQMWGRTTVLYACWTC
jgi:hypothetical protein